MNIIFNPPFIKNIPSQSNWFSKNKFIFAIDKFKNFAITLIFEISENGKFDSIILL